MNGAITTTKLEIHSISADVLLKRFDAIEDLLSKNQNENPKEKLLTRNETAALLGVSLVTLHSWVKLNILKGYRIGNKVRFKEHEVMGSLIQINTNK